MATIQKPVKSFQRQASPADQQSAAKLPGQGPAKLPIPKPAQEQIVKFLNNALNQWTTGYSIRSQLELRDRAYLRTKDRSQDQYRAQAANDAGDPSKTQNPVMPVVMPQVESAVAYAADTFLTGYPIFGVVAPPDEEEQRVQMETKIGEDSIYGAWPLHLTQAFRDGYKHNLGAVEVTWEREATYGFTTPDIQDTSKATVETVYFNGNKIKRIDPYNLLLDIRVSPAKNHLEGEFAGYTDLIGRIETKRRMQSLDPAFTMNYKAALESTSGIAPGSTTNSASFFIPQVNPAALMPNGNTLSFDWMAWVNNASDSNTRINYQNFYEWTVLYARILPSEFGIQGEGANHVQIWKFIIINRQVCIFAQRQTNMHQMLPIICCVPNDNGLGWQEKSLAENAMPYQDIATSLMTSAIESQRRKVYDRIFYDPTKINKKDIDQVSSVARIAVKAPQYGKSISESFAVVPYNDNGVAEIIQMAMQIADMADVANGQNRVQRGQFQKGNKTRTEFETVMNNSNSRQKIGAGITLEYSFITPIKQIIKSNILQYAQSETLINSDTKQPVKIDPTTLRQASLSFKISDGVLPTDKLMSAETFGMLFQAAPGMPALNIEYDLMGAFVYYMKLRGANWLEAFKRSPEQQTKMISTTQQAAQAAGQTNPPPAAQSGQQEGAPQ